MAQTRQKNNRYLIIHTICRNPDMHFLIFILRTLTNVVIQLVWRERFDFTLTIYIYYIHKTMEAVFSVGTCSARCYEMGAENFPA
jgi:hypothetical protein